MASKLSQVGVMNFDLFVWEIFVAGCFGGTSFGRLPRTLFGYAFSYGGGGGFVVLRLESFGFRGFLAVVGAGALGASRALISSSSSSSSQKRRGLPQRKSPATTALAKKLRALF